MSCSEHFFGFCLKDILFDFLILKKKPEEKVLKKKPDHSVAAVFNESSDVRYTAKRYNYLLGAVHLHVVMYT